MFRQRNGWIGLDIGTSCIKVAQIAARSEARSVVAAERLQFTTLIDSTATLAGDLTSLGQALDSIEDRMHEVRDLVSGTEVAICLPASLVPIRSLEVPQSEGSELMSMIAEEIAAETPDMADMPFGYWENSIARPSDPSIAAYNVVTASTALTDCISDWLWHRGFEPVMMDVQYCAMARNATISSKPGETCLMVDFGHNVTTLVVSADGKPLHARQLRNCGLVQLLKPLCDYFELGSAEAFTLLNQLAVPSDNIRQSATSSIVADLISLPLEHLISELKKTISYYQFRFGDLMPEQLQLCGCIVHISDICKLLGNRLEMSTKIWALPKTASYTALTRHRSAEYANALAVSSLIWEASPCM